MQNTLFTITGKIEDEQANPARNKAMTLFYCGEEVFRAVTDESGYFTYNHDRLKRLYEDTELLKRLVFTVSDSKIVTTDVCRLITHTFDNKEVKAIKVRITIEMMR